jgi:hypothetical protein
MVTHMIYYSKKDLWIVLIVLVAFLIPLIAGAYNLIGVNTNRRVGWQLLITGVTIGVLILVLTYPLYYEITPSVLIVKSGLRRWEIPLSTIEEVQPSQSSLASPAWSLDRLSISYMKDGKRTTILVSPENKTEFLAQIAQSAPQLRPSDGGLVRTPK